VQSGGFLADDYVNTEMCALSDRWSFDQLSQRWLETSGFAATRNDTNYITHKRNGRTKSSIGRTSSLYDKPKNGRMSAVIEQTNQMFDVTNRVLDRTNSIVTGEDVKNARQDVEQAMMRRSETDRFHLPQNTNGLPTSRTVDFEPANLEFHNDRSLSRSINSRSHSRDSVLHCVTNDSPPTKKLNGSEDASIHMTSGYESEASQISQASRRWKSNSVNDSQRIDSIPSGRCHSSHKGINRSQSSGFFSNVVVPQIREEAPNNGTVNHCACITTNSNSTANHCANAPTAINSSVTSVTRRHIFDKSNGDEVHNSTQPKRCETNMAYMNGAKPQGVDSTQFSLNVVSPKHRRNSFYDNMTPSQLSSMTPALQNELDLILSELYYNMCDNNLPNFSDARTSTSTLRDQPFACSVESEVNVVQNDPFKGSEVTLRTNTENQRYTSLPNKRYGGVVDSVTLLNKRASTLPISYTTNIDNLPPGTKFVSIFKYFKLTLKNE